MAVNTEFLGSDLTTQFTGSDASFAGDVYVAGAANITGAVDIGGALSSGAQTVTGTQAASAFSATASDGGFYSDATTASVTTVLLADNEFGFFRSTNSTVDLIYRSGVTLYHWVSSQGSVA